MKDITPSTHEDEMIVYDRWVKKAITESVSQIYGAESYLSKVNTVQLKDSEMKIILPSKEKRIIHRVAIAFGAKEHYPLPMGDFEKGYVSVFDEKATSTILKELDTITDFTNYLTAKEKFSRRHFIMVPYETDFLAFYLQTGLSIAFDENVAFVGEHLWDDYIETDAYKQWVLDKEVSYVWDIMIQCLYYNLVRPGLDIEKHNQLERAIRLINLETRSNRATLGLRLENTIKTKVKARMVSPFPGAKHTYVFMVINQDNWEYREAELGLRCIIARTQFPETRIIIGIGIGVSPNGQNTFDVHHLDMPDIDDTFIKDAEAIKNDLGLFKNIRLIEE